MNEGKHGGPDPDAPHWEALARHLTGENTPGEAAAFEALLAKRPSEKELLAVLGRVATVRAEGPAEGPDEVDVENALENVKARRNDARPRLLLPEDRKYNASSSRTSRWTTRLPALAAAGLLAVGIGSWIALRDKPETPAITELPAIAKLPGMLATGVGVRDSIRLPDGTQVILGPLSSIRVAADYGQAAREVEIRGDAWFEVVHESGKPFTVHAGSATIIDIGTRFAVRTDSSRGVAVTVTEGTVSLRHSNTPVDRGVILEAGDNGQLNKDGEVVARRGAASGDDVAWLQGRLVFRDAPIEEVITSMRRWYGIELRVADSSLKGRHLTATFDADSDSASAALEILRLALGAVIEQTGDTAIIRRRSVSR